MLVIDLEAAPAKLRGRLSRWCVEVRAGLALRPRPDLGPVRLVDLRRATQHGRSLLVRSGGPWAGDDPADCVAS